MKMHALPRAVTAAFLMAMICFGTATLTPASSASVRSQESAEASQKGGGDEQGTETKVTETADHCATAIDPDAVKTAEEGNQWVYTSPLANAVSKNLKVRKPADGTHSTEGGEPMFRFPVVFHVITNSSGNGGWVTMTHCQNQINVLNAAYEPHGISFYLQGVSKASKNDSWYECPSQTNARSALPGVTEQDMKETLNTSPSNGVLHVYLCEPPSPRAGSVLLGFARFPLWYDDFGVRNPRTGVWSFYETDPRWDGIVLLNSTLPGGQRGLRVRTTSFLNQINNGKTLVHEAGHWLGLYHTFQTSTNTAICEPDLYWGTIYPNGYPVEIWEMRGDFVRDTPTQSRPTNGTPGMCGTSNDTCPSSPGLDPVNNFMDYNDQGCQTQFTAGQRERMHWEINVYRPDVGWW